MSNTIPYPLSGGSYRCINGGLIREDVPPAGDTDAAPIAVPAATEPTDTGDTAAHAAEPSASRRRSRTED